MERRKEGRGERGRDLWRLWPSLDQMVSVELSFRKQTRWPRPWSPVLALTAHLFSSLITHRPVQTATDLLPLCWKMINSASLPPERRLCPHQLSATYATWQMLQAEEWVPRFLSFSKGTQGIPEATSEVFLCAQRLVGELLGLFFLTPKMEKLGLVCKSKQINERKRDKVVSCRWRWEGGRDRLTPAVEKWSNFLASSGKPVQWWEQRVLWHT